MVTLFLLKVQYLFSCPAKIGYSIVENWNIHSILGHILLKYNNLFLFFIACLQTSTYNIFRLWQYPHLLYLIKHSLLILVKILSTVLEVILFSSACLSFFSLQNNSESETSWKTIIHMDKFQGSWSTQVISCSISPLASRLTCHTLI